MSLTPFDELQRISEESGVEKSLEFLESHFRNSNDFFKLFEILKMKCRHGLGLPLIYSQQPDDLTQAQQRELEDGLLSACREVGTLFFKSGEIQQGWAYLQPVGDKRLNEELVCSIVPNEENVDAIIEVAILQGAAPSYGFALLLKHHGTCDGITTFDTQAPRFDAIVQRQMASALVHHIHDELFNSVRQSLKDQEQPSESTPLSSNLSLSEIIESFPGLSADGARHIDPTHLASAMRIARLLEDSDDILVANQLANFGSKLPEDFQYPSAPPFEDTYLDHGLFFSALLGEQVDQTVQHFKSKTESVAADQFGPVADETLVDLLVRVGKIDEALEVATQQLMGNEETIGIAPSVFEIARNPAQLKRLGDVYRSKNDLLGFAVALLKNTAK